MVAARLIAWRLLTTALAIASSGYAATPIGPGSLASAQTAAECTEAIAAGAPVTPGYLARGLQIAIAENNRRRPGGGDKLTAVYDGLRTAGLLPVIEEFLGNTGAHQAVYFARGSHSLVFDLGNGRVLQMGWGTVRRPPVHDLVNQPISTREVLADTTRGPRPMYVEVYEKLDTTGITQREFLALREALARDGIEFIDRTAGVGQLGRNSAGRVVVLDPGAVRLRP